MLLLALACAQHGEVALRSLDGLLRRGEALAREQRGEHAAPRRVPRVERLGHGAEVFLEPRGLGGGEREGRARLAGVEAEEAPRGGGRAHGAEGARGVEPLLVVRRVDYRPPGRFDHRGPEEGGGGRKNGRERKTCGRQEGGGHGGGVGGRAGARRDGPSWRSWCRRSRARAQRCRWQGPPTPRPCAAGSPPRWPEVSRPPHAPRPSRGARRAPRSPRASRPDNRGWRGG